LAPAPARAKRGPTVNDPYVAAQFFTAVKSGRLPVVKALVGQRKVDPRRLATEKGKTPLMVAAGAGQLEVVKFLVASRVSVNAKDVNGTTALMLAAQRGHKPVVELLLKKGADRKARRRDGALAVDLARKSGRAEIARLLEPKGAQRAVAGKPAKTSKSSKASKPLKRKR
jgi:uncharacterized protein